MNAINMTAQLSRVISKTLSRVALAASLLLAGVSSVTAEPAAPQVTGLWTYTGLTSSKGVDMPLSGIFLFSDGKFLQQAVFNGEPYAQQQSMAHSGTYTTDNGMVQLAAGQTLSLDPASEQALADAGASNHNLTVSRDGDALTLVFGSGTKQTFDLETRAKNVEVYPLVKGMLAFADGYFVLVNGDAEAAVTGYGKYRKEDSVLLLDVIRWSEAANGLAQNLRDVTLSARFDGSALVLADGRRFVVTP